MMTKIKLFLAIALVSLFISCNPNDDVSNTPNQNTNFSENFGASVSRDFIGQVVDAANQPIQNATIAIGTKSVQTDANGVFIINGATVHEKFAYITAKKSGYINGSRAMVPTNGKNNVRIMLLTDTPISTIQSGTSSEVSIYSGTKVVFDGAFQDENGNAYSGAVSVSMFHLTPSDENISKLMPGMLYAETASGTEAVLETFGMLNVELHGSAGQKLQIASGHTAQITMRIDDNQLATAPATIPLWHFDETNGYWKEDGSATKVGNYFVGNVSHFSWWNCDTFSSVVNLTVTFVDNNGHPISNIGVSLVVNSTNFNSYVQYTDNLGQVSGLVPKNQLLTLNTNSGSVSLCGYINGLDTSIGPFSTDTIYPNIVLSNANNALWVNSTIVGSLVNCDGSIVTNGYVTLNNNESIFPVTNGSFNFIKSHCSNSTNFTLRGYDYDIGQETGTVFYNFDPSPITNVGDLNINSPICNYPEYISYRIDGSYPYFLTDNLTFNISSTNVVYVHGEGSGRFMTIDATATGSGVNCLSAFILNGTSFGFNPIQSNVVGNAITYNSSPIGAVGTYVDVTFNGTFVNSSGSHTVSGLMHIIRDN